MIGVSFGAPTEFKSNGKIIEEDLPHWAPGNVSNAIDQDDLYVEMTFAEVMDRIGLDATTEEYGEAFARASTTSGTPMPARAAAGNRYQGPVVGPPEVQRPRQRHRLPD